MMARDDRRRAWIELAGASRQLAQRDEEAPIDHPDRVLLRLSTVDQHEFASASQEFFDLDFTGGHVLRVRRRELWPSRLVATCPGIVRTWVMGAGRGKKWRGPTD
jgi:hypothetical protein